MILLEAYTWGDGDLPDEFEDFYEELDDLNFGWAQNGSFLFGGHSSARRNVGALLA
ncbi:NADPH-dependent FMN reductase family protein [Paenibacillus roseipurpureus]|uniref:hypothetical protein n=1 Tax=Paenibacillus roseopurpureus TaxID=2918901 RepID=UPI0037CA821A